MIQWLRECQEFLQKLLPSERLEILSFLPHDVDDEQLEAPLLSKSYWIPMSRFDYVGRMSETHCNCDDFGIQLKKNILQLLLDLIIVSQSDESVEGISLSKQSEMVLQERDSSEVWRQVMLREVTRIWHKIEILFADKHPEES